MAFNKVWSSDKNDYEIPGSGGSGLGCIPDGTEAAPGLVFCSDTDTGFWWDLANTINFSTGATQTAQLTWDGSTDGDGQSLSVFSTGQLQSKNFYLTAGSTINGIMWFGNGNPTIGYPYNQGYFTIDSAANAFDIGSNGGNYDFGSGAQDAPATIMRFWTSTVAGDFSTHKATIDETGNFALQLVGQSFRYKEGSNACMGTATLSGGAATVSTTAVTASSRIFLTIQSLGTVGVPKAVGVTARTAATSFTITSADATDTSVIAWHIHEPT